VSLTRGSIRKSVVFDCAMLFVSKHSELYDKVLKAKKFMDSRKAAHRMVCAIVSGKGWDRSAAELGYVLIYELDSGNLDGRLTDTFCNLMEPWFKEEWNEPVIPQSELKALFPDVADQRAMEARSKDESKVAEGETSKPNREANTTITASDSTSMVSGPITANEAAKEERRVITPRTGDEWKNALKMWENPDSKLLIESIENMKDEKLNRFIKMLVEEEEALRNFIQLVDRWNNNRYYEWDEEGVIEVRTTIIGGLYALAWLLQTGEINIYADYERYFSPIHERYNNPANKIYNFPSINKEIVKVDDEDVLRFSLEKK